MVWEVGLGRSEVRTQYGGRSESGHTRRESWGHETVDDEIFADALRRPEIEAMRAWAKNLRRRSHEAKTLLGTSPIGGET